MAHHKRRAVNKIILHCSDSDYPHQDAEWIDKIHREEKGWDMIGYHFFITFDGAIQQGRDLQMIGAHCYGHNQDSVGICLAGRKKFKAVRSAINIALPGP